MHFCFPKSHRIRRRKEFVQLGKKGKMFSSGRCSAQWMLTDFDCVRLGLTVSARKGPAVKRNLFKRRAREAFRISSLRQQQGVDLNIRPHFSIDISFHEFIEFFNSFEKYLLCLKQR